MAIADEFPHDASQKIKSGGLMHDRRVARIITPGTLIDENFMDPYANNYIMALHLPDVKGPRAAAVTPDDAASSSPVGVAWLDLSTGAFLTQATTMALLTSVLSRVSPREIVLDRQFQSQTDHDVFAILAEDKHLITYSPPGELRALSDWAPVLEEDVPRAAADKFSEDEVKAGSLLLHYVKDRLQGLSMKLQPPQRHQSMQSMTLDKNSMRSLEIKQTIRDSVFRGSLLHAIRRTVTKSGARLLNEWLSKSSRPCSGQLARDQHPLTQTHATLGAPSTSIHVIDSRLDLVSAFVGDETLRASVVTLLKRTHDSQRLVQKFALNRGEPDELLRLASTIQAAADIATLLQASARAVPEAERPHQHCFAALLSRISLEQPQKLADRIRDAIDEEALVQQHHLEDGEKGAMLALAQDVIDTEEPLPGGNGPRSKAPPSVDIPPEGAVTKSRKRPTSLREYYGEDNEVWTMKQGASPVLQRRHRELAALLQEKADLTVMLRARLNAPSLTLRWTPGLGHICHVKGKDAKGALVPASEPSATDSPPAAAAAIRTLTSSRSTRSFHQPEWTRLGERLDRTRLQIRAEEQRVFVSLRQHVILNLVKLRRNAAVLDELDIATSFAQLARDHGLARPVLKQTPSTLIVGGRHPTVEGGLTTQGRSFQPNDCFLESGGGRAGHGRVWLVTGPNMGGKSTFLRQVALTHVLAQTGCYVPASHAELGVVDAVFARVGSADDLYRDRSTFMVEMLETAGILRQATPQSLVVMDEIGRGTTPEDGTAVAFASLQHLVRVNRCRALFATHFHGVADLVAEEKLRLQDGGENGQVEMYCTDVQEDVQGGFMYIHKLQKGINRQSHALKVARLAGLPEQAIHVARQVIEKTQPECTKPGA